MKQILTQLKNEIKKMTLWISVVYALGVTTIYIITLFNVNDKEYSVLALGSLLSLGVAILLQYVNGFLFKSRFSIAVCMSQTRKEICKTEFLVNFFTTLAALFYIYVLAWLETTVFIYGIYKKIPVEIDIFPYLKTLIVNPVNLLTFTLLLVSVQFFVGTIVIVFEKYGAILMWTIYMACCFIPVFANKSERLQSVFRSIKDSLVHSYTLYHGYFLQLIVCIACSLLLIVYLKFLKKQAVSI